MITVMQAGTFTTVQDKGRWGYQAHGMPVAGAMDEYAFQMANLLAGNDRNAAVFEMTGTGAAFKFDEEMLVSICGADMQGCVNDCPAPNWSSFIVPKKGELRFGRAVSGYRAYLAVRGGVDVPLVLGSRATYARAKIGGYEGRPLRQGDVLCTGRMVVREGKEQGLEECFVPVYQRDICLRVMLGLQHLMFGDAVIRTLLQHAYRVDGQSDRSACILTGPSLITAAKTDIISEAVSMGAIQIPASGVPFIVMADHQTIRGFAKVGHVIQADRSRLAQIGPGDAICFTGVGEAEAITAWQREQRRLKRAAERLGDTTSRKNEVVY